MINVEKVKRYCRDDISKIENYDKAIADTKRKWDLHHRLELTLDGYFANSVEDLKRHNMYFNRPYFELVFLTHAEHTKLHQSGRSSEWYKKVQENHSHSWKGKHHDLNTKNKMATSQQEHYRNHPERRKQISDSNMGDKNPFYGKTHTDEFKEKMSKLLKGKTWKIIDGKRVWFAKEEK